jgi:hypothetical protein
VLAMSALNETTAKRIAKLFRLLNSSHDGEVVAAVTAMKRLFVSEGLSFNDLATVIESCNGEIEERKYSDSDAEIIFARGVEKGRAEESQKQKAPPEFYDADGNPRWYEIAVFCRDHSQSNKLSDWEREFVTDMPSKMLRYEPSPKQAKYLIAIFVKLGGYYARAS